MTAVVHRRPNGQIGWIYSGQLNLSGTERVLVGMRPLDQERRRSRRFSGYDFRTADAIEGANAELQSLFFEGDLAELFPAAPFVPLSSQLSFAVGRMPLIAQQGLLINEDRLDAVTMTRNGVAGWGFQNLRVAGVYAWKGVNRNDNSRDPASRLYAVLSEADWGDRTLNLDVTYADHGPFNGDLLAVGASSIQRIVGCRNTYNASLHLLASTPTGRETAAAGRGELVFAQFSWQPKMSRDNVYLNGFWAIDQFTSAARGPLAGGPLGQMGLLFAAAGIGRYGAALSNEASDAVGASLGYQMFFDDTRQQVVLEVGGRKSTGRGQNSAAALGPLPVCIRLKLVAGR